MPIKGTLTADFASFYDAVQKAEVSLKGFEASSAKVGAALNRMGDSLSGNKIHQEATLMAAAIEKSGAAAKLVDSSVKHMGDTTVGVSRLTVAEQGRVNATVTEALAKYKALGQEAPESLKKLSTELNKNADATKNVGTAASGANSLLSGMAKQLVGMFTIGAVVAFGREILAAGDAIQKMADQTGLSTEEVQKLQHIAGQSGTSIQSLVGAVQNLQQRLGDDNSGATGAIKKLGINFEDFKKLDPYSQMVTLADGIRGIQDPTEQAAAASAIFGKSWKEILPAIKSGMKEVGDAAFTMSDQTVRSLDQAGDALNLLKSISIVAGATILEGFAKMGGAITDFLTKFNPSHFGVATSELIRMQGALNDPTGLVGAMSQAHQGATKLASVVGGDLKPVIAATAEEEFRFNQRLDASVIANAAAAAAAKQHAGEVQALVDRLGGAEAISAVNLWMEALPKIGGLTKLSAEDLEKLGTMVDEAIEAFTRAGNTVPPELMKLRTEIAVLVTETGRFKDNVGVLQEKLDSLSTEYVTQQQVQLRIAVQETLGSFDEFIKRKELNPDMFPEPTAGNLEQWKKGQTVIKETIPALSAFREAAVGSLDAVVKALSDSNTKWGSWAALAVGALQTVISSVGTYAEKAVAAGQAAAVGIGGKVSGGMGATLAGIASGLGGAALEASKWGVAMGIAGTTGAVALGAATLGIGLAAVGVVKLIANWKEHKEMVEANNKALTGFTESIWATLNAEQVAEAGGREWAATVIAVRDAYEATGRTGEQALTDVKAMWDATTVSTAATKAAMDKVNQAFIEQKELIKVWQEGGVLLDAITTKLGGIHRLSPALQSALEAALDADTPLAFKNGLVEVNRLLDESAKATKFLDETMKKYNLTWKDTTAEARAAYAATAAAKLEEELLAMRNAGIDVNVIMRAMGGTLRDFVSDAVKSGTEVPESFRDVIQTAIDAGEMFDAAGNKISNMSQLGITFGTSMASAAQTAQQALDSLTGQGDAFGDALTSASDRVKNAVQLLIDKYKELAAAIRAVPAAPKAPTTATAPATATTIPKVTIPKIEPVVLPNFDLLPMARGGRGMVKKPTLFLAGEEGPEEFAFSGSGKKFGGASRKAGSGIVQEIHINMDSQEVAYLVAKHLPDVIDLTVGR